MHGLKELRHGLCILNLNLSIRVNSSPSLTILVPSWFIITSLVFFRLTKLIFCGFLYAEGYFARCKKRLKRI